MIYKIGNNVHQSFFLAIDRHRKIFNSIETHHEKIFILLEQILICYSKGGKVVWFGNGGSAADAQHLAAELMVRYKNERGPFASISLNTDTSILTAHSNDYDFTTVFERQVLALVKPIDLVVGITTSGKSLNVCLGLEAANTLNAYTVAFTGCDGGSVSKIANLSLIVNSNETARIQEMHIFLGHWLCEALDLVNIDKL